MKKIKKTEVFTVAAILWCAALSYVPSFSQENKNDVNIPAAMAKAKAAGVSVAASAKNGGLKTPPKISAGENNDGGKYAACADIRAEVKAKIQKGEGRNIAYGYKDARNDYQGLELLRLGLSGWLDNGVQGDFCARYRYVVILPGAPEDDQDPMHVISANEKFYTSGNEYIVYPAKGVLSFDSKTGTLPGGLTLNAGKDENGNGVVIMYADWYYGGAYLTINEDHNGVTAAVTDAQNNKMAVYRFKYAAK